MAALVTMLPLIVACQIGGSPESRIDRLQLDAARDAERRCDWAAAAAEYGALYAADRPGGTVGLAFARSLRRAGRYGEAQEVVGLVLE
jgi:hypothetical protein